jgi:endonuclease G, mitochondrial
MSRNRIYGLTIKQWTALLLIIIAIVVFGCRFCYNFVRDRVSPDNNSNIVVENNVNANRPSRPTTNPASSLSIEQATDLYLKLGNPSNAAQPDANNYLMVNPYFALSYNRARGTANWVAWVVRRGDIGNVERANDFRPDNRLPQGFPRVTPNDYTGSGFDRGHLCPSKDRSNAPEANSATFLMSNMIPQAPDSNQGVWKALEDYSRDLVEQGNEIYVVAGVAGERGRLKNKVTIPASTWKIVAVLPENFGDASQINQNTRVFAVDIPNQNGIRNDDWRKYRTTVRQLEQKTGYNFFSNLPQNQQDALETKMDGK